MLGNPRSRQREFYKTALNGAFGGVNVSRLMLPETNVHRQNRKPDMYFIPSFNLLGEDENDIEDTAAPVPLASYFIISVALEINNFPNDGGR